MTDIANAIKQVCDEKGLSYEAVITTIESALAAAYRKDFGEKNQNIKVQYDPETSKSKIFDVKIVVEDLPEETDDKDKESSEKTEEDKEIDLSPKALEEEEERKFNPKTEIQLSDAKLIKKTAKIGDEIKIKLVVPEGYGRMAAQTAKQVIIQRLREAEREMIFNEFKGKEKEVVSGVVQRREGRIVLIDLGKTVGILLQEDQIFGENYRPGERIKVYVKEVRLKPKGPEIILSRTSGEILKKVFYLEIPEISNGLLELKKVAREAGSRSKVAVWAESEHVDPIGSCVGQRGARIQTIISELGGEKVDIIQYDEDPVKFITNSLSPAKIISIKIDDKNKKAIVKVSSDQLSLAIGKGGQNVRLAAKLTGWKIDILESKEKEEDEKDKGKVKKVEKKVETKDKGGAEDKPKKEEKKKNDKKEKGEEKEGKRKVESKKKEKKEKPEKKKKN